MSDLLYDAAVRYKQLENDTYEILLGRKGKLYTLMLHFPAESFYHLVGLQHLTDITFPSQNRERIFKEILQRNITMETLKKSVFFEENFISERIENLYLIENIISTNDGISYRINPKDYIKYTTIQADYLFEYKKVIPQIFYFFSVIEKSNPRFTNECKGCSFFCKHKIDYTKGTSKTTILMITKITKDDETRELKYKSASYKEPVSPGFSL